MGGVPRRIFERVPPPGRGAARRFKFAPQWLTGAGQERAGELRIRTDVGAAGRQGERRMRRAMAVAATHHGYDVLPGGIVRPVQPAQISDSDAGTSTAAGRPVNTTASSTDAAVPGWFVPHLPTDAYPRPSGPFGSITDPTIKPPRQAVPSSNIGSCVTAESARLQSNGDDNGALVRISSAPPNTIAEAAPAIARSNSSPTDHIQNQPPAINVTSVDTLQALVDARNRSQGKGKGKNNMGAPKMGVMKPPRLARRYSELQESPIQKGVDGQVTNDGFNLGDGAADQRQQEQPSNTVDGGEALGDNGIDGGAVAGPGPSTLAMVEAAASHVTVPTVDPGIDSSIASAQTSPTPKGPLFSQPPQTPYNLASPASIRATGRNATESEREHRRARAPDLLLGMSKGKGKARAAEPEVAKESGQLVRAQSINKGSPTSIRYPSGTQTSYGSGSASAAEEQVERVGEGNGEEGWARRRRVSSTASGKSSSTPSSSLGKAAATEQVADVQEAGETGGLDAPSPTPMSPGIRRSARLGTQVQEKAVPEEVFAAPSAVLQEGLSAARRLSIPTEWQSSLAENKVTEAPGESAGGESKVAAIGSSLAPGGTSAESDDIRPISDDSTAVGVSTLVEAAGPDPILVPAQAARNASSPSDDRMDTALAYQASQPDSKRPENTELSPVKTPRAEKGSKTSSRDTTPDATELWEEIDKIDTPAPAPGDAAAPPAPAPAAGGNANVNARVMRAQLGGVGVELQIEQRPAPRRAGPAAIPEVAEDIAAVDPDAEAGLGAMAALIANRRENNADQNAVDAAQLQAGADDGWEDVPDDAPWNDEDEGGWVGEDWEQMFERMSISIRSSAHTVRHRCPGCRIEMQPHKLTVQSSASKATHSGSCRIFYSPSP